MNNNITVLLKAKIGTIVAFESTLELINQKGIPNDMLKYISIDDAKKIQEPIINLIGKDEVNFNQARPVFLVVNSQHIINTLNVFFPNKRFVVIKRWENLEYRDPEVWEEYEEILELDSETIVGNGGRLEVLTVHDQITITNNNSKSSEDHFFSEDRAEQVLKYPGWSTADHLSAYYYAFDYDKLYIYEEEVYHNLEVHQFEGMININGVDLPYAPKLILDTPQYRHKIKFK